MNPEILEQLRLGSQPRDWADVKDQFKAAVAGYEGDEPVYKFYSTLTDNLEVNPQSISISVQPQDSYIPFHIHNYAEMTIPLLGSCTVVIQDQRIEVGQENIIVIGRGVPHRVENTSAGSIVVNLALKDTAFSLNDLNFMLHSGSPQSISHVLMSLISGAGEQEAKYMLVQTGHEPKIVAVIYDIIGEYYSNDVQANQIIRFDLLSLFSRLIRLAFKQSSVVETDQKTNKGTGILDFLLYIEKNYQDITLEKMAKDFGYNPNYLSAYLKKYTGQTFIKLVHLQRINVAAEYLTYTSGSIEKIALKVGYENPSYFYKVFKKYFKCSPKEYRQREQENE
ncbi:AraC family transcriptional regulator [Lactobacillus delbrueckii]|uniref:AraC family transcriptional regulator n=1 Tax=Lactobacillus delbrueckii TaxID=1584 RepID=UPI001F2E3A06|nr:helix-turn-helix domain-containing protein [Lactobacillus delbrueckii]GHN53097.1 AraC family transcriptional regulator [Lactobacillus delbrueckii]